MFALGATHLSLSGAARRHFHGKLCIAFWAKERGHGADSLELLVDTAVQILAVVSLARRQENRGNARAAGRTKSLVAALCRWLAIGPLKDFDDTFDFAVHGHWRQHEQVA